MIRQKQSFRGVLKKRCFENMQQIYKRIPMPKRDFNKSAKQEHLWTAASSQSCVSLPKKNSELIIKTAQNQISKFPGDVRICLNFTVEVVVAKRNTSE